MTMTEILMIEDDKELAEILTEYLAGFNIKVTNYDNPELGLSALNLKKYKLVILDLSLPEMDGLEVCRLITSKHNVPVIISSARSDISDKVACLQMGADDYMPKPYDPRELAARIQTVLRRYATPKEQTEQKEESDFILDEEKMEILHQNSVLKLTPAEYGILRHFIKRKKHVVSREELINNVEVINYESSSKSIDVIIGRLRQKIEDDPRNPRHIISLRGIGYKFLG
jgi:two-component system OmpR family response regulator